MHDSIGDNIQGPSIIRVPSWVEQPLGLYYLYFADHKGRYIRLAYADDLKGPWHIHEPGSLQLEESHFPTQPIEKPSDFQANDPVPVNTNQLLHSAEYERSTPHIASPDVHVVEDEKRIYMYFHGLQGYGSQRTRLATSTDGIAFSAEETILCQTYLRVAPYDGRYIGMLMPGVSSINFQIAGVHLLKVLECLLPMQDITPCS